MQDYFFAAYDQIKNASGTRLTNIYATDFRHYLNQLEPNDEVVRGEKTILVKRSQGCFDRIEFISKDLDELKQLIASQRRGTEVLDLISRTEARYDLTGGLGPVFYLYRELVRMTAIRQAGDVGLIAPSRAQASDIEFIERIFAENFDPCSERIPSRVQLHQHVQDREILLCRSPSGLLSGFLIHNKTKRTNYLKYIFVDLAFRGQGVGKLLLEQFVMQSNPGDRMVLWVFPDNPPAIGLYQAFGFRVDGTVNFIFKGEVPSQPGHGAGQPLR